MAPGQFCWVLALTLTVMAREASANAWTLPRKDSQSSRRQEALALVAVMV